MIESLNQKLEAAKKHTEARTDAEYMDLFPASQMPVGTRSLSFEYNVSAVHWIHISMQVNEERSTGKIQVHDSRRYVKRAERNFQEVAEEVSVLAKIVSQRPELGWQEVQWEEPESVVCPQQENSSDCGFFAHYCAWRTALGQDLQTETMNQQSPVFTRALLRWEMLECVYNHVLHKKLEFSHNEFIQAINRSLEATHDSKSSRDHSSSEDSDEDSDEEIQISGVNKLDPALRDGDLFIGDDEAIEPAKTNRVQPNAQGKRRPGTAKKKREARRIEMSQGELFDIDDSDNQQSRKVDWKTSCSNWRADIRQILCNIMLEDTDEWWFEPDLVDRALECVTELAELHDVNVEGEADTIKVRTSYILWNTPWTFAVEDGQVYDNDLGTIVEGDTGRYYSLRTGPGRLVDTDTQRAFLSPPRQQIQLEDGIESRPALILSIVRNSAPVWTSDAFDEMDDRAEDQFKAFWRVFGYCSLEPERVHSGRDLLENLQMEGTSWASYVYSGTSADILLDQESKGQCGQAAQSIRKLLRKANEWAFEHQQNDKLPVALLQGGPDGGSSNNDTWGALATEYPNLDFRMVMVFAEDRMWHEKFFRIDESTGNGWASFNVSFLAALYSEMDVSGYDVEHRESHQRLLTACTLVQNLKIDHSVKPAKSHGMVPKSQNVVASVLSFSGRKSFPLGETDVRICEECGDAPEFEPTRQWTRGRTSAVALRCDGHPAQTLELFEEQILEVPAKDPQSLEGPSADENEALAPSPWFIDELEKIRRWSRSKKRKALMARTKDKVKKDKVKEAGRTRNYRWHCRVDGCGSSWSKREDLLQHRLEEHGIRGDKPWVCEYSGCGQSFAAEKKLAAHYRGHTKHPCPEVDCDFVGNSRGGLTVHRVKKHNWSSMTSAARHFRKVRGK